jgi:hypothetical protein
MAARRLAFIACFDPIEATLGVPTPVPTPLHVVSGTLGSSMATPMKS